MLTKATFGDLKEIDKLAVLVINDMKESGIPQWDTSYPRYDHYYKDIQSDGLIKYVVNGEILGVMTILPEDDPPYKTIDSWLREKSIVLHRILVHPLHRKKGIAKIFLDYAFEIISLD